MASDLYTPVLPAEDVSLFKERGYVVVKGFLSKDEVAALSQTFERLMSGELAIPGKDHGEHTPGLMNVTVFSRYHALAELPPMEELDRRCLALVRQLYADDGGEFKRDYEQLLRKLPSRPTAVFPPHQGDLSARTTLPVNHTVIGGLCLHADMHYWPKAKPESSVKFNTRTATCSIAVNDANEDNGCLWVLPGSHKSNWMYPGCLSKVSGSRPVAGGVIKLEVLPEDVPRRVFLPLAAGDMSVSGREPQLFFQGAAAPVRPALDPRGVDCARIRGQRLPAHARHADLCVPLASHDRIRAQRGLLPFLQRSRGGPRARPRAPVVMLGTA